MPIHVDWDPQQPRIMRLTFIGKWNRRDFIAALDACAEQIFQTPRTVHVIYDFNESAAPPRDMLAGLQHANRILPPNQGVVVYLNANSVVKAFLLMAKRYDLPATRYIYNADSYTEALALIRKKAPRMQTT